MSNGNNATAVDSQAYIACVQQRFDSPQRRAAQGEPCFRPRWSNDGGGQIRSAPADQSNDHDNAAPRFGAHG
jgi:hypothetical protein